MPPLRFFFFFCFSPSHNARGFSSAWTDLWQTFPFQLISEMSLWTAASGDSREMALKPLTQESGQRIIAWIHKVNSSLDEGREKLTRGLLWRTICLFFWTLCSPCAGCYLYTVIISLMDCWAITVSEHWAHCPRVIISFIAQWEPPRNEALTGAWPASLDEMERQQAGRGCLAVGKLLPD